MGVKEKEKKKGEGERRRKKRKKKRRVSYIVTTKLSIILGCSLHLYLRHHSTNFLPLFCFVLGGPMPADLQYSFSMSAE
jgi:hypothetical protein